MPLQVVDALRLLVILLQELAGQLLLFIKMIVTSSGKLDLNQMRRFPNCGLSSENEHFADKFLVIVTESELSLTYIFSLAHLLSNLFAYLELIVGIK